MCAADDDDHEEEQDGAPSHWGRRLGVRRMTGILGLRRMRMALSADTCTRRRLGARRHGAVREPRRAPRITARAKGLRLWLRALRGATRARYGTRRLAMPGAWLRGRRRRGTAGVRALRGGARAGTGCARLHRATVGRCHRRGHRRAQRRARRRRRGVLRVVGRVDRRSHDKGGGARARACGV